jgi:DNA-binding winged helix-turn-helix (wHTH) protein
VTRHDNISSAAGPGDFHLGDWVVRPSQNRLEREAEIVHLEPKVMDLLVFLAGHAGQVVPKTRLIDEVWRTEFIADSALTRAVGELRRALGETAREPQYLETITKRGYRLMATVEYVGEPPADQKSETSTISCAVMVGEREVLLEAGENVIGRDVTATVRIDSTDVSRRHARIVVDGDGASLEDLGSKNGTSVWGRSITAPTTLRDGDRIGVCGVLLIFRHLPTLATTRTRHST